jgi:hypothetical protein
LEVEGTDLQKKYFGEATIIAMREKALKKWHELEASTTRKDVRDWLDVSISCRAWFEQEDPKECRF